VILGNIRIQDGSGFGCMHLYCNVDLISVFAKACERCANGIRLLSCRLDHVLKAGVCSDLEQRIRQSDLPLADSDYVAISGIRNSAVDQPKAACFLYFDGKNLI
jgi:hypothetical protein